MRIRTDPATRNRYLQAGRVWVRDYTQTGVRQLDDNRLFSEEDQALVTKNELVNVTYGHSNIADETIVFPKVVIISDGLKFSEHHEFIRNLPEDVSIIAVNKTLTRWNPSVRPFNLYLINNPYPESMGFMSKLKYYPVCIASTRTHPNFVKSYQGHVYNYTPTPELKFGRNQSQRYCLDDYRNPICAAINLAYQFNVQQLLLLDCDQSLKESRAATVPVTRGEETFWTYEQHLIAHSIIDAQLYWLTHQENHEVQVADFSSGLEYKNAAYIKGEQDALDFLMNGGSGVSSK